jgi:hypothetical protein
MTARRLAPVAGLFLLAPLVGEYLLGNATIVELRALPILGLLYGSGAILIREAARRTGGGPRAMIVLGLAYGLAEAALIDQTLWVPPVVGPDVAGTGSHITALGFSAANLLAFVGGHAVWSITCRSCWSRRWSPTSARRPGSAGPGWSRPGRCTWPEPC